MDDCGPATPSWSTRAARPERRWRWCARRSSIRIKIITSDAFSEEKTRTTQALGAQITLIPSENRRITAELINAMIDAARKLSREPGHWWFDQLNNPDAAPGYASMGEEIWEQSAGRVDAFVQAVGSAHSLNGVAKILREHNPDLQVVAAEPAESPVLAGGARGAHRIEGIGLGFIPPHWRREHVDEVQAATTEEAMSMCRRLAREEGIFAGTSSGLNVIAALRVAAEARAGRHRSDDHDRLRAQVHEHGPVSIALPVLRI